MASSLSVRSFARPGFCFAIHGASKMQIGTPGINTFRWTSDTYLRYDTGPSVINTYSGGNRALSFALTGPVGEFHGTWTAEGGTVTSDRRLKTGITPLRRTLAELQGANASEAKKGTGDGALWMLRQLRPVSYSFKAGSESKYMRFGFIADELETTVPQVVRSSARQGLESAKAVQIYDLVALLTAAGQSQQEVIESQERMMDQVEAEFEAFKAELKILKELKEKKRQANRALACGATRKKRRRLFWR